MGIKGLLVHVILYSEALLLELVENSCVFRYTLGWHKFIRFLCIHAGFVFACMKVNLVCRIHIHVDELYSTLWRHIEIWLCPWGITSFFLLLLLGETNRPVMQQWEALNAKHIIREGGRERRVGDKKKTGIEKRMRKDVIRSKKVTNEGLERDRSRK